MLVLISCLFRIFVPEKRPLNVQCPCGGRVTSGAARKIKAWVVVVLLNVETGRSRFLVSEIEAHCCFGSRRNLWRGRVTIVLQREKGDITSMRGSKNRGCVLNSCPVGLNPFKGTSVSDRARRAEELILNEQWLVAEMKAC